MQPLKQDTLMAELKLYWIDIHRIQSRSQFQKAFTAKVLVNNSNSCKLHELSFMTLQVFATTTKDYKSRVTLVIKTTGKKKYKYDLQKALFSNRLHLILWSLLFFFMFLFLRQLEQFRNHFIPKRHPSCSEPTLYHRFQAEDEILLILFCKCRPEGWRIRIRCIRRSRERIVKSDDQVSLYSKLH